jgi:hypothetical protein
MSPSKRSGPFWDAVEGRASLPRAAATLGLEVVDVASERGTIELGFAAKGISPTPGCSPRSNPTSFSRPWGSTSTSSARCDPGE